MSEIDRISNTYVKLGEAGTPARDSALPKFISDTQDWIGRVQPLLDQHPDAPVFLPFVAAVHKRPKLAGLRPGARPADHLCDCDVVGQLGRV
jgi:hypothetical protein